MTDALWRSIDASYRAWAGIGLGERRREPVLVALATLAAELGHASPEALLAAAAHPDGEPVRDRVIARISVGLTWFTREQALLEPALARAHAHAVGAALDRVAVWSAGCSTGEEPYAIAMALLDRGATPRVLATDISIDALAIAARARYPRAAVAALPERWRARYLVDVDRATVAIAPAVRACVSFARHNLAADPAPPAGWPRFELVVCRNVLIYFDPAAVPPIAARLAGAARTPDGLVVGAVEKAVVGAVEKPVVGAIEKPRGGAIPTSAAPPPGRGVGPSTAAVPRPPSAAPTVADPIPAAEDCLRRAIAARQEARHAAAIVDLRRARLLADDRWLAPYLLGLSLEALGQAGPAVEAYRHAVAVVAQGGRAGLPEVDRDAEALAATVAAACHARLAALGDRPAGPANWRNQSRRR